MTKDEFLLGIRESQWMSLEDGKLDQILSAYVAKTGQTWKDAKFIYGRIQLPGEDFERYQEGDPEMIDNYDHTRTEVCQKMFNTLQEEFPEGLNNVAFMESN